VTQLLRRAAKVGPQSIATEDATTRATQTYAGLLDRVARLAAGLRGAGLSSGARVAVLGLNSAAYLEMLFAVPWAGGVVVPVNIRLAPPEMLAIFEDCEVELVCVDSAFQALIPALLDKMGAHFKGFVTMGAGASTENCLANVDGLVQTNEPGEDLGGAGDDLYGLFYTGGTTGKPKGVMLSHGSVLMNAMGNLSLVGFSESTRYLHCAPMFHLADAQMTFAMTMAAGTHVFLDKFTPPGTLSAIQDCKVTAAVLVPVMIKFCLGIPGIADMDLSSLQAVVYGGSPMAPSLLEASMKAFPSAKFYQGYGMTEAGPAIAVLRPEDHIIGEPRLASAGKPVPFAEVQIVDENDNPLPTGQVGEIVVRGPHTMIGYWRMPEQTAKALRGGWLHTGDGGCIDENGFIYIKDRIKDMIITGGENVYSVEVEAALADFEAAAMSCVIGTPDEKFGELVTAVIQPKEGREEDCSLEAVKAHCQAKIAGYKCPRKVVTLEKMPISGAGKVLKHEVRKQFWEGHEMAHTFAGEDKKTAYA